MEAKTEIGDSTRPPDPLVEARPLVPADEHGPLPETFSVDHDSHEALSYAARRERLAARHKQSRRSSRWTAVAQVLLAANVALLTAHDDVVRYLPQTTPLFSAIDLPVNLRLLQFENVKILKDIGKGANLLIVKGTIVSTSDKPVKVTRLRFTARDATGQGIYTWTALSNRSILDPGEHLYFRSRLASPPADATTVMVRFLDSHCANGETK